MSEQVKPFHVSSTKGRRVFGIRNIRSISVLHDRPWYGGWFWINGRNTAHLWDKEGRYMRKSYGYTRIVSASKAKQAEPTS